MPYCNIGDVKDLLGIEGATEDALIDSLVNRAQKFIERYTERVFEASADSTRYFDADDTDGDLLYLDEDLCQITSITNDGEVLADYRAFPRNTTPWNRIEILNGSWGEAEIVGRWAWSVSAPEDIVQACVRVAAYWYRMKDAQVFDVTALPDQGLLMVPKGLPADVKLILDPYCKVL